MKLIELVNQIQTSAGDPGGDVATIQTVLDYINDEIRYVAKRFPEKVKIDWTVTSAGFYHSPTFDPEIEMMSLMVDGIPVHKTNWEDLRARIGNAV